MTLKDTNLTRYKCSYDCAHMKPFVHHQRNRQAVLDSQGFEQSQPLFWRHCSDRDLGVARESIPWQDVVYVDFKLWWDTSTNGQMDLLRSWLLWPMTYKVLHAVNDCLDPWENHIHLLSNLEWRGDLYVDVVSRHTQGTWADWQCTRDCLLDLLPWRGSVKGFDWRDVDQHTGIALHKQIVHPGGTQEFWVQYD